MQKMSELDFIHADDRDLPRVNTVIASAINAWPASERLKRNALIVLQYDRVDLQDTEIIIATDSYHALAVAAWHKHHWSPDPSGHQSPLLHGLFVSEAMQKQGIGLELQQYVARLVLKAGGHGMHVRAERFAVPYFERMGYRQLAADELVSTTGSYQYRFWIACDDLIGQPSRPDQWHHAA